MAAGRGLLARAWESVRSIVMKETRVGSDAFGNTYYKFLDKDLSGQLVERRRVRVPGNDLLYDPRRLPPEWRSWLARTRDDPPSDEEMARAAARKEVMAARVAAIDEREKQRRYRMDSLGQQATSAGGPDMSKFLGQASTIQGSSSSSSSSSGGSGGQAAGGSTPKGD